MCAILETGKKSAKVNVNISRSNVLRFLQKHPRSPLWISNDRIANYCGIKDEGDVSKTAILGKYLPRGTNIWERSQGLISFVFIYCTKWCGLHFFITWEHFVVCLNCICVLYAQFQACCVVVKFVYPFTCFKHVLHVCLFVAGVGRWDWGTRISFFRFPKTNEKIKLAGNNAANTQAFINLLDDVSTTDTLSIKDYLHARGGVKVFRSLVSDIWQDDRIVSVVWADSPKKVNKMTNKTKPVDKICHDVRTQMLKMLRVGAIVWPGFTAPLAVTTVSDVRDPALSTRKKAKTTVSPTTTSTFKQPSPSVVSTVAPSPSPVETVSRGTQTDPQPPLPATPPPVQQQTTTTTTQGTQTVVNHFVPLSGTYSVADRIKDECVDGLNRLRKTTPTGFHWTSHMIVVLLRFLYYCVVKLNWSWRASCDMCSDIFNVNAATVGKLGKLHRQASADVLLPPELPRKVRGRGSDLFKANDVNERFKIIKEEHLKCILNFVRERNRSMSGMCTVRTIVAHLLQKYGKLFKYHTVRYALAVRLGLKYRTTRGSRIVFTPQRIHLADTFCEKIVKALREEAAGESVLVYMDETYCHQHHMPSKAW